MKSDGVELDPNVIASAINAYVELNDTKVGCCIHGFTIKKGLESDVFMGSSLIELYSTCGQPEMAGNIFSNVSNKNLVVWNSLISCYCQNGLPMSPLVFFIFFDFMLDRILHFMLHLHGAHPSQTLPIMERVAALIKVNV